MMKELVLRASGKTTAKMLEEFEAWWRATMNIIEMDLHRFADGYSCHETNRGWMAWKASRAALCVELPKQYSTDSIGSAYCVDAVIDSLDSAGVCYK